VKLLALLDLVKGFFGNGGAGNTIGNTLANGGVWVALIAALTPAALWLIENKDFTFVTFSVSYGQFFVICCGFALYLKIVHYTRPGSPTNRDGGQS
jgi:hypothetical protein